MHLGHMTKMATIPTYGKTPSKNLLLKNRRAYFHETWYVTSGTPAHHSSFKCCPVGLTLTYFTTRSNLVTKAFLEEKVKTVDFSETIAASDLKVSRSIHLIEYINICEY